MAGILWFLPSVGSTNLVAARDEQPKAASQGASALRRSAALALGSQGAQPLWCSANILAPSFGALAFWCSAFIGARSNLAPNALWGSTALALRIVRRLFSGVPPL